MHTHTYIKLQLSRKSFQEIARKLKKAGYYEDRLLEKDLIGMQGIAVAPKPKPKVRKKRDSKIWRRIRGYSVQWVRRKLWTVPGLFRSDGTGVRGTLDELDVYLREKELREHPDRG